MSESQKTQILEAARKAIHTEMLALGRMEETLGDEFARAVETVLACRGKCIVTGMGKSWGWSAAKSRRRWLRPEPRVSFCIRAKRSTATWG